MTDLRDRMLMAMHEGKLPDVRLNPDGSEVTDPVPMAPPIGYKKQPSMVEIVREMIRNDRLQHDLDNAGYETFEEADDFDVDDDYDPTSPFEEDFDPIPVSELKRRKVADDLLKSEAQSAKSGSSLTDEDEHDKGSARGSDEGRTRSRKAGVKGADEGSADE